MMMSNTIAWIIVLSAAVVSSVSITAAVVWTVKERRRNKAGLKLALTLLLFLAVIFLMGFLSTIVHL